MGKSLQVNYKLAAIEFPAIHPLVQQCWKLKPPVTPSISKSSPAKYNPGINLLSNTLTSSTFKSHFLTLLITSDYKVNYRISRSYPNRISCGIKN